MIKLVDILEENLNETYEYLIELLNPNNSYKYETIGRGFFKYLDSSGTWFYVRAVYQPTSNPFIEIKTWWMNDLNEPIYDKLPDNVSAIDWDKRSNTLAKIYKDEIIPFFDNQDVCVDLVSKPIDIRRYKLTIRMFNKFLDVDKYTIIEDLPKKITLRKK